MLTNSLRQANSRRSAQGLTGARALMRMAATGPSAGRDLAQASVGPENTLEWAIHGGPGASSCCSTCPKPWAKPASNEPCSSALSGTDSAWNLQP